VIFVIAAFVVTLSLILGIYWRFVIRPERQTRQAFWRRLRTDSAAQNVSAGLLKQAHRLSSVPAVDAMLQQSRQQMQPIERLIEQSGSRTTVGAFVMVSMAIACVVTYAAYRVSGMFVPALGAGVLAATVPTSLLRMKRTKRLIRFEEQFPEALALVSRALKAGHTLTTGMAMVAEELPSPIGPEFKLLYDQQNYGMPFPDALKEFADRVPLLDARFFVTAVLIQRESGGNLAEVLDNIASVIRDRFRVKRQIRVISAHARMTGWVLIGVPPALAGVLFIINPDHWNTMIAAQLGIKMLVGAVVLQVVGSLIIRKMVRIEY
jgi:tight adherence protein B